MTINHNHARSLIYCIAISLIIFSASCFYFLSSASSQNEDEPLISVNSSYYDRPYKYWTQKWWEWNLSFNETSHPNTGYSDKKCGSGQTPESPVWFLVQPFPYPNPDANFERTCTVPQGKAIITPTQSGYCNDSDKFDPHTDVGLINCAKQGNEDTTVEYVTIDNKTYKNYQEGRRVLSDFFNAKIIKDNVFRYEKEGNFKSVVDGYYIFLKPLGPGKHILEYYYKTTPPKGPTSEFYTWQKGKWNLIIK